MRARELPALLFVCIWVLGFEVVPVAHQAMHAALGAHEHASALTAQGPQGHCHGAACHAAGGKTSRRPHGDGSLEHRGLAVLAHELTVFVPERMLAGEQPVDAIVVSRLASFERRVPPARGPPA